MYRNFSAVIVLGATFVAAASTALAQIVTTPPGAPPGYQYRLVFVTSTTTDATNSSISYYNTFVTTDADSVAQLNALGTTWTDIGSTSAVTALTNTNTDPSINPIGVSIFNLAGQLVAPTNTILWSGNILNPIDVDENGNVINDEVWTGTNSGGTQANYLGPAVPGPVTYGFSNHVDSGWVTFGSTGNSAGYHLYAISDVITVVPEPSTMVLAFLAAAGLAVPSLRRLRHGFTHHGPFATTAITPDVEESMHLSQSPTQTSFACDVTLT